MKGKHSGVQRRIRNINPRAFFVPCSAHSLNLIVNDAVKSSKEAIEFFDIIQKVYVFIFGIFTPLAKAPHKFTLQIYFDQIFSVTPLYHSVMTVTTK
jgi:hypothetical protein